MPNNFSLMIHGGAGSVADKQETLQSIREVLEAGRNMLAKGAGALDTVEHCVSMLENDPHFNAGHGSVLNHHGQVDLDASIMDGRDLNAGAVAGVTGIKNPIQLARTVMEKSEHVFLIGKGAEDFAQKQGLEFASQDYFVTDFRRRQWEEAKASGQVVLDHSSISTPDKKFGTVGAVAYLNGDVAAATSTGGIVNKKYGRVGDSPVIGAGTYAENGIGAISATGYGEQFLRTVIAKHIADIMRFGHLDAQSAAEEGIAYLVSKVKGLGGVIVLDASGRCGKAYSTPGMIWGKVANEGPILTSLS